MNNTPSLTTQKPILIIGAGIGGLSAAIHLAAAGRRVVVLEKNPQVGGKMSELQLGGYRFDTGPSVITLRQAFESLFAAAGRRLEDYLDLHSLDPLTRYFYPNGTVLNIQSELSRTLEQIAALEPADVQGYQRFLAYSARLFRITAPVFIFDQPPTWRSFARVPVKDWLAVDGLRSMQSAIQSHVRSPELRQLLGRFATYVGASPYQAPATLNVIAHLELNQGVWYPSGGIYQIARAYERLALELGVEIRTSTPVRSLDVQAGQVRGVILSNGGRLAASAVLCNLDAANAYAKLMPASLDQDASLSQRVARQARFLSQAEPSGSGFILMLGVRGQHTQLAHHNIFFSSNYPLEFEQIFRRQMPPSEPTIYVAISSKSTPTDAPPGCENWFVLVNVPALSAEPGQGWDWSVRKAGYRQLVLDLLARRGFDLAGKIEVEHILTPSEIETLSGAQRGALYGASSNNRWAAFLRPHNRDPLLKGLYFAGGTVHPGGGVPMVTLSGQAAAGLILQDGF